MVLLASGITDCYKNRAKQHSEASLASLILGMNVENKHMNKTTAYRTSF